MNCLDRLMAKVVRQGQLEVSWSDGRVSNYGEGSGHSAKLLFHDAGAERALLRNPELALGEAYMDRNIEFLDDTLLEFLLLMHEN